MDDVAASRRVIATSGSSSRLRKGSADSGERATRTRGVGGAGERRGRKTKGGIGIGGRKVSLTDEHQSVHDLRLGRKGSKVAAAAEAGGGGGGAAHGQESSSRGKNSSLWTRNHAQVKIIAATRVRKGSATTTSFKDLILHQDDDGGAAFSAGGAMLAPNPNPKKKSSGGGGGQRGRSPKQNTLSANSGGASNRKRSSSTRRTGASSPRPQRRGSFQDETQKEDKEEEESARRSSQQLKLDTLAQLAMKVKALGERDAATASDDGVTQLSEDDQKKLASICNVFAGGKMLGKKTFKDYAKEEILREPSEIDKMIAGSKVIAAFGRRNFEEEEICPDLGEPEEDEENFADDNEELKFKVRAAKAKYLAMFDKKESKEEKDKKKLTEMAPDPKAYGLWDSVSSIKALPTLMRAKREWVPPDWDKIVQQLKEEGRDVASIDADLKDICHGGGAEDVSLKKTGKYLMPDDILWCRKHARFREKDLLKWFRRFREKCPKGTMNREVFAELFKSAFPLAEAEVVTDIIFEVFDPNNKEELDFKEFLIPIDAVNCREFEEKLRWALSLWDQKLRKAIDFYGMKRVIELMDQVEENGYMDGPTDEDLDEIYYRKKLDPPKLVEDRATDVFALYVNNADGTVDTEELAKTSQKIIYARE